MRSFPRLLALALMTLLPVGCTSTPEGSPSPVDSPAVTFGLANHTVRVLPPVGLNPPGVKITYGSNSTGVDVSTVTILGFDGSFHVEGPQGNVNIRTADDPSELSFVRGSWGGLDLLIDGEPIDTRTFDPWFSDPPDSVSIYYAGTDSAGNDLFVVMVRVGGTTGKFTIIAQ